MGVQFHKKGGSVTNINLIVEFLFFIFLSVLRSVLLCTQLPYSWSSGRSTDPSFVTLSHVIYFPTVFTIS